jgi:folate-binding protein YgfZ
MYEARPDHGDATAEYRAGRGGSGLIAGLSQLVWITGGDVVTFLDGQLSQDLVSMAPGGVARSLLLEPRGKLVATMWVLRGEDRVGLVVDAGRAAGVVQRLDEFRFRVDVEVAIDDRLVWEVWGPRSGDVVASAGWDPGPGWALHDDAVVARLDAALLHRVIVVGGDPAALEAAGARRIGTVAADTIRIETGEPVMGVDLDESTIPQESGLVPVSVSFTKGCYVGQELVARIDSRGRVNRRLVGVVLRTNVIPPVGAAIMAGDDHVGTVTTVGESLSLRAPVALAMVRREVADRGAVEIRWDGGSAPATIRDLPLADSSAGVHTPLTPDDEAESGNTGA